MGTKNYRYTGFTLIELLITLSIVAILATIAIMYVRGQAFKGNDARRKADMERIRIAVEEYEKDHNCYPPYVICGIHPDQPIYPYLNNVPCDPDTNASYFYDYEGSTCPSWYRFYSKLYFTQDPDVVPDIGPNSAFNYVTGSANAPTSVQSTPPNTSSVPNPTGGIEEPIIESQYYGCKSGACVPIAWDETRPGPECDPSFQSSDCYGRCGPSVLECKNIE
jgi:prepilin-type N-terminal cleavage/methylation domain-containing protein